MHHLFKTEKQSVFYQNYHDKTDGNLKAFIFGSDVASTTLTFILLFISIAIKTLGGYIASIHCAVTVNKRLHIKLQKSDV
jgi:hypothetical protein